MPDTIVILDYGSQFTQLIARRVREASVYSEILPWDAPAERALAHAPRGVILSGSHHSVNDAGAPTLPAWVLDSGVPVLGICYGMQLLAKTLGGHVALSDHREYGHAVVRRAECALWGAADSIDAWMSHGDRIETLPPGFTVIAHSGNSPFAGMADTRRNIYAIQFHPEVAHTSGGSALLARFVREICGCAASWTPANIVDEGIARIRAQVGSRPVLCGLSGGVDSSVVAAMAHRAVGAQLTCVFVDTGMMRRDEAAQVIETFQREQGIKLIAVNATEEFLEALAGVTDPEEKRKRIGEKFIRVFEHAVRDLPEFASNAGAPKALLAQGTLYPDVIESRGPERQTAHKIKTHHNVGGLPADMQFELLEPLDR